MIKQYENIMDNIITRLEEALVFSKQYDEMQGEEFQDLIDELPDEEVDRLNDKAYKISQIIEEILY